MTAHDQYDELSFSCPDCESEIVIAPDNFGKTGTCAVCGSAFEVPSRDEIERMLDDNRKPDSGSAERGKSGTVKIGRRGAEGMVPTITDE